MGAEMGCAVVFAGPLKHAGFPITGGTRVILVLFMYIEDFHYGPFLQKAIQEQQQLEQPGVVSTSRNHQQQEKEEGSSRTVIPAALEEESSGGGEGEVDPDVLPSGDRKGGYVVYRQTVELVNMLQKSDVITD